jgi:putative RecB family exonuclease
MASALSPSSISTWETCPKQYHFTRILRVKTSVDENQALGLFVHRLLQAVCEQPPGDRDLGRARSLATSLWAGEDWQAVIQDLKISHDGQVGLKRRAWERTVTAFELMCPASLEVVATEMDIQADMAGVPMHVVIDLVTRESGALVVSDYKTGAKPVYEDALDRKFHQLATYAALLEVVLGERPALVRLAFLEDGRLAERSVDEVMVGSARDEAAAVWAAVNLAYQQDRWPTQPGKLCAWCPCIAICPFHNPA